MFNFQPPPGPAMLPFNPQSALAAFRPPPPINMAGMGMPGMGGMMPQSGMSGPTPQQGAGMLSNAMSGFKGFGVSPSGPQGTGAGGVYTPTDAMGMFNSANAGIGVGDTGFQPAMNFLSGGGGAAAGDAAGAGIDWASMLAGGMSAL